MSIKEMPKITAVPGGKIWTHTFEKFKATVFVPHNDLMDDVLNYGFIAPYLLVFGERDYSNDFAGAVEFARINNFEQIAKKYGTSVVFIYPTSGNGWKDAAPDLFSEIISNSKIHEFYEDGVVKFYNRFTKTLEAYYIRGGIFHTNLYGFGESADYIAENCINHFEGDGLWGRADCAPVAVTLTNLTSAAKIKVDAEDIPVVSYGNTTEINAIFKEKCKYFLEKQNPDIYADFEGFVKQFRRMIGELEVDPDLEKDGMQIDPAVITVKTSPDNLGKDKGTTEHKIGYFAFYNKGVFDKGPVPLVLAFHGGGDSSFYIAYISDWAGIAHRHDFLLVAVENHLNSTATEMVELVDHLKKVYNIDPTRIYASGFSMGGIKTWDIIQEYPELVAAAAPMDATVDIGENVYFGKIDKPVNTSVSVPIFYAAGEKTPLAELPYQEQKCINRMAYALKLNGATKEYNVKLEEKDKWQNKLWGVDGDYTSFVVDPARKGKLTMNYFTRDDGKCWNIFAGIDNQGHECRPHTCEYAWRFLSCFTRDADGVIHGGELEQIKKALE